MAAAAGFGYTAYDVAEAIGRFSAVANATGVCEHWQAVSAAAGNGTLNADGAALESLKFVYNSVEAVILPCSIAPETFNIYEVCFEVLTKIGFCLRDGPPKDMLLQLLENIHEVYDVLLSCVETYEFVQPGVTGFLRLWMMQVLFACCGNKKISGQDLMMLTDNDVIGVVSLIASVLRCKHAPFEMQSTAGQCLVELTTADCVFLDDQGQGLQEYQSQQIQKLTQMLNRHVNGLIKGMIQFEVVEAFGLCICQHQMAHSRTDAIVKYFLTTIHNCLLYCSENQKHLRQHLATQSTIVQDIMIPYVDNILPALYDNPKCGPNLIEWQNLKSTLQTFVVVTFNMNVFRPQLRDGTLIPRVCQVPTVLTHISMLELLIKIALNVDFAKGHYFDWMAATLQAAFEALPAESKVRLQRRLTSEKSMRLPYTKSNLQASAALAFALSPPPGEEVPTQEAVATRQAQKKSKWRHRKNKNNKWKRLFNQQQGGGDEAGDAAQQAAQPELQQGPEDDSDDDVPPLIPAGEWETCLGVADEAGVPSGALCQLSGTVMLDPMATPEGHLFERAALEDWCSHHATNPMTGAPLDLATCREAHELLSYIQGYQLQVMSACHIAPYFFDTPDQPACDPPAPAAPVPAPPVGPSLLGDLPALQKEEKPKKKEKRKIHIESRSVVDCPKEMRCAVDGKVMINPLRSPYGHMFEKKTLDKWMANCGSVCPITGQPLRIEECVPDAEMKKQIVKFLKCQD